jgi:plastocyanin
MRLRRRFTFGLAALLGAAVVVLPAVAGSETSPTIAAVNSTGYYGEQHHAWSPPQVTVSAGGVVTLSNPTMVPHGVEWRPGAPATPSCTAGVPVGSGEAVSGTSWSGTCTFAKPGTYTFYCTVHHSEMTGTITVNANGTTTTTTTNTTQPSPPGGGSSTTPTGEYGSGAMPGSGGSVGSPLAGSASKALRLSASQRGKAVSGSLKLSQAGAGARLEVDLLAKSASLAKAGHPAQVRVGRLQRSSLQPGKVSFTVALDARAKRALGTHRRLALTVKIVLVPKHGSAVTVTRGVVLHA